MHKILLILVVAAMQLGEPACFAEPVRSINKLPGGGANYADGLFDGLERGVWLIVDKPSRDPEVLKWLEDNNFGQDSIHEVFSKSLSALGMTVLSRDEALKRAREDKVEETKVIVFMTVSKAGNALAVNMNVAISRLVEIPGRNAMAPAIVWSSGGATSVAVGHNAQHEAIIQCVQSEIRELGESLYVANSIRQKPLSFEEWERIGHGERHPRLP